MSSIYYSYNLNSKRLNLQNITNQANCTFEPCPADVGSGCCFVDGVLNSGIFSQYDCETLIFGCEESMGPWDSGVAPHPPCPSGWITQFEEGDSEQRYQYCYQYSYKLYDYNSVSGCGCPSFTSGNPYYGMWPGKDGLSGFNLYAEFPPYQTGIMTGPGSGSVWLGESCDDLPDRVWIEPCTSGIPV